jgi:predicted helicase
MRRAVAFSRSIKDSKNFSALFSRTVKRFVEQSGQEGDLLECEVDHVDGKMTSLERQAKLKWLKADTSADGNVCRILSNAKCLSEGVDVPTLDAVLFLNPRNSMVDVVQSVGRAMRKADGKQYGYIIIPISIPADVDPEKALNDNKRYKVVWDVCQALRAHDDRFEATVNKIKFNVNKPDQIDVTIIGEGKGAGKDPQDSKVDPNKKPDIAAPSVTQLKLDLPTAETWQNAILGKIAKKCGSRDYWENWAKDVSVIAESHIDRIKLLLRGSDQDHQKAFEQFVKGLRKNLNPSVTEEDAIEMLAQHLITKPVFDALFEGYEFAKNNPVSKSFKKMIDLLEDRTFEKDQKKLDEFYDSVRRKVGGIDNAAAKQTIIKELYDKFFNLAFPRMAERLGIVYTPIEVVDFIVKSADAVLNKEFGLRLTDRGVHILDPFTGTGTFMVRLLQSGLIKQEDLEYKYCNELHANEIVLLAYYIAAINIEETFHGLNAAHKYVPFDGIVLADTFQMNEGKGQFEEQMFPENNKRVKRQIESPIQVILGNPPYSVGQSSQNDGNQNTSYPHLDARIEDTYAKKSSASLKRNLYDSYVRAIRWATDRIKDKGIICFVTNGSFVDANNMDGLRKSLKDELTSLYIFNLRGNARTQGEERRKEKGNVFGEGSRTPVAISILVKNPVREASGEIFYKDIGDYLSREEKLRIISEYESIDGIDWEVLKPNDSGDWISQRDPAFAKFLGIGGKDQPSNNKIFEQYSLGIVTSRDLWSYNFSKNHLEKNISHMIDSYNKNVDGFSSFIEKSKLPSNEIKEISDKHLDLSPQNISWSRSLKKDFSQLKKIKFSKHNCRVAMYRPFIRQWLYFDRRLIESPSQMPKLFPEGEGNKVISITGIGINKEFSAFITDTVPDFHLVGNTQSFPLYTYSENVIPGDLLQEAQTGKQENITQATLSKFKNLYGEDITGEDIFYYVYGVLHSKEYKKRFESDLKKMLPRIPFAKDFWAFSKAGRELATWHLNYETVDPYPLSQDQGIELGDPKVFQVSKMYFPKINGKEDQTKITVNNQITLGGIPLEAYEYVVNGKSAIEGVIERYQTSSDKESGISNDPNDWCNEIGDPEYLLNLVKRIVRVSVESVRIINALPKLEEIN